MASNWLKNVLLFLLVAFFLFCDAELDQCPAEVDRRKCFQNRKNAIYRTINGECNNVFHPSWGTSNMPFLRLLPAQYQDGKSVPIAFSNLTLYNGVEKPNARMVSNNVMTAKVFVTSPYHSALIAHFGQFLAHDFSLQVEQDRVNCSIHPEDAENCYNIQTLLNRTHLLETHAMPFHRTMACVGPGVQREALNQVTTFIDASQVYGSTELRMRELREFRGGRLRVNAIRSHRNNEYLPFDDLGNRSLCFQGPENKKYLCFLAGDPRPSEHIVLTAIHTIFMREHNRIAGRLGALNPRWDDEILFQESRKILIGVMQKIVYDEWLPKILGQNLNRISPYFGYRPDVDPRTADAFGAAVMRFGHGIMPPVVERRDANYGVVPGGDEPLSKIFFATEKVLDLGGTDPIIRGVISQSAKEIRGFSLVNSEMTQNLFPHNPNRFPLDLGALNIQRAREHAIPAYKEWREFCRLQPIDSWDELRWHVRAAGMVQELQRLYQRPENIDLWVAGLIEQPVHLEAKLGPTFTCLLTNQFGRFRDGDRFFYENPGVFSNKRLRAIKRYSMAKLICNTADEIVDVPPDAFSVTESRVNCSSLPDLDLRFWKEAGGRNDQKAADDIFQN